ncbi:MAG: DUF1499 domain-containing protein [Pseudomonadota bacterium]
MTNPKPPSDKPEIPVTPDHDPVVTDTPVPGVKPAAQRDPVMVRLRRWVLRITLALAVISPLVFMLAGLGSRLGLWSWQFGLGTLTREVGPMLLFATLIMGGVSLLAWFFIKPRRKPLWGLVVSALAVLVPVAGLVQLNAVRATAASLPFIHDITTDTQDPPSFGATIMAERDATPGVNTVAYAGKRVRGEGTPLVSALQTQAYPEIRTLVLSEQPGVVFGRAEQAARDLGWAIKESDAEAGRIDATDTTFWYGFKDDVTIRLRPAQGGGTRLDVRSVSRVGGSDLGANAARIGAFLDAMAE